MNIILLEKTDWSDSDHVVLRDHRLRHLRGVLKAELGATSNQKDDLESKLQHARGDVAGELAALTSTMIKMKEDALNEANIRIAALTSELDELRSAPSDEEETE